MDKLKETMNSWVSTCSFDVKKMRLEMGTWLVQDKDIRLSTTSEVEEEEEEEEEEKRDERQYGSSRLGRKTHSTLSGGKKKKDEVDEEDEDLSSDVESSNSRLWELRGTMEAYLKMTQSPPAAESKTTVLVLQQEGLKIDNVEISSATTTTTTTTTTATTKSATTTTTTATTTSGAKKTLVAEGASSSQPLKVHWWTDDIAKALVMEVYPALKVGSEVRLKVTWRRLVQAGSPYCFLWDAFKKTLDDDDGSFDEDDDNNEEEDDWDSLEEHSDMIPTEPSDTFHLRCFAVNFTKSSPSCLFPCWPDKRTEIALTLANVAPDHTGLSNGLSVGEEYGEEKTPSQPRSLRSRRSRRRNRNRRKQSDDHRDEEDQVDHHGTIRCKRIKFSPVFMFPNQLCWIVGNFVQVDSEQQQQQQRQQQMLRAPIAEGFPNSSSSSSRQHASLLAPPPQQQQQQQQQQRHSSSSSSPSPPPPSSVSSSPIRTFAPSFHHPDAKATLEALRNTLTHMRSHLPELWPQTHGPLDIVFVPFSSRNFPLVVSTRLILIPQGYMAHHPSGDMQNFHYGRQHRRLVRQLMRKWLNKTESSESASPQQVAPGVSKRKLVSSLNGPSTPASSHLDGVLMFLEYLFTHQTNEEWACWDEFHRNVHSSIIAPTPMDDSDDIEDSPTTSREEEEEEERDRQHETENHWQDKKFKPSKGPHVSLHASVSQKQRRVASLTPTLVSTDEFSVNATRYAWLVKHVRKFVGKRDFWELIRQYVHRAGTDSEYAIWDLLGKAVGLSAVVAMSTWNAGHAYIRARLDGGTIRLEQFFVNKIHQKSHFCIPVVVRLGQNKTSRCFMMSHSYTMEAEPRERFYLFNAKSSGLYRVCYSEPLLQDLVENVHALREVELASLISDCIYFLPYEGRGASCDTFLRLLREIGRIKSSHLWQILLMPLSHLLSDLELEPEAFECVAATLRGPVNKLARRVRLLCNISAYEERRMVASEEDDGIDEEEAQDDEKNKKTHRRRKSRKSNGAGYGSEHAHEHASCVVDMDALQMLMTQLVRTWDLWSQMVASAASESLTLLSQDRSCTLGPCVVATAAPIQPPKITVQSEKELPKVRPSRIRLSAPSPSSPPKIIVSPDPVNPSPAAPPAAVSFRGGVSNTKRKKSAIEMLRPPVDSPVPSSNSASTPLTPARTCSLQALRSASIVPSSQASSGDTCPVDGECSFDEFASLTSAQSQTLDNMLHPLLLASRSPFLADAVCDSVARCILDPEFPAWSKPLLRRLVFRSHSASSIVTILESMSSKEEMLEVLDRHKRSPHVALAMLQVCQERKHSSQYAEVIAQCHHQLDESRSSKRLHRLRMNFVEWSRRRKEGLSTAPEMLWRGSSVSSVDRGASNMEYYSSGVRMMRERRNAARDRNGSDEGMMGKLMGMVSPGGLAVWMGHASPFMPLAGAAVIAGITMFTLWKLFSNDKNNNKE